MKHDITELEHKILFLVFVSRCLEASETVSLTKSAANANSNLTFFMRYSSTGFTRGKKLFHPLFVISCTHTLTPGISFTKTHVTCFIILSSFIPHIYPSIYSVSSPPPISPFFHSFSLVYVSPCLTRQEGIFRDSSTWWST